MAEGRATFVGREGELRRLGEEFSRARAGLPGLVVVEGAAGIGKTTLVRRFLELAGTANVLLADGDEGEKLLAYGTLTRLFDGVPPAPLAALGPLGGADPLAVGAALLDVLSERQQHEPPLCLVVDDLHWADAPTLRALTFCLRRLRVDRVLTVLLLRDAALLPGPEGLVRLIAADTTCRLRLTGLAAAEVEALAGGAMSARAAARLVAHTEGVPLHLRALLEEVPRETLADVTQPLPAPRSYAMLVLGKVARCGPAVRELVGAVSVLGQSCPLHVAARVAEIEEPLQALEEAVAAGLLLERSSARGPVAAFAHPLVRAAVHRDLGPAHRSTLHARAAPAGAGAARPGFGDVPAAGRGAVPGAVRAGTGRAGRDPRGGQGAGRGGARRGGALPAAGGRAAGALAAAAADAAGAGGGPAGGDRDDEPAGGQGARAEREDHRVPPGQHLRQAGGDLAGGPHHQDHWMNWTDWRR